MNNKQPPLPNNSILWTRPLNGREGHAGETLPLRGFGSLLRFRIIYSLHVPGKRNYQRALLRR